MSLLENFIDKEHQNEIEKIKEDLKENEYYNELISNL